MSMMQMRRKTSHSIKEVPVPDVEDAYVPVPVDVPDVDDADAELLEELLKDEDIRDLKSGFPYTRKAGPLGRLAT